MVKKKGASEHILSDEQRLFAFLSYLLGWLTGLIFYFAKQDDMYIRYHAAQSIVLFGGLTLLFPVITTLLLPILIIPFLGFLIYSFVSFILLLGGFVLWVYSMIKAYQGERFRLPLVTDLVEKYPLPRKK